MNNITSYTLKATHQSIDDGEHETNVYERTLHVEVLSNFEATFYDPELKIAFEDKRGSGSIYEIETDNVQVALCSRLKKAEDFIRRVNYQCDWLQLKVRNDGKIVSFENKEELKSSWKELREIIEGDYMGDEVEEYLEEVSQQFVSEEIFTSFMEQYFYFGLLFPRIPITHGVGWASKKTIEFSAYEKEKFEERLAFIQEENGLRNYKITGNAQPESKVGIEKFEGVISVPNNSILPENAELEIIFHYAEHTNQWNFVLDKINSKAT